MGLIYCYDADMLEFRIELTDDWWEIGGKRLPSTAQMMHPSLSLHTIGTS